MHPTVIQYFDDKIVSNRRILVEIISLRDSGNLVGAIKLTRKHSDMPLKQAVDYVRSL
jgi:hypothetical protein